MLRTVVLCVALVMAGTIGSARAEEPPPLPDPTGVYRCTGLNPDGTRYSAIVEIKRLEKTYRVLWQLSDQTVVIGVGIVTGDVLAVSYFGGTPAIVVYRKDGEKLVGEWTVGGQEGAIYSEELTLMPDSPSLNVPAEPPARPEESARPERPARPDYSDGLPARVL